MSSAGAVITTNLNMFSLLLFNHRNILKYTLEIWFVIIVIGGCAWGGGGGGGAKRKSGYEIVALNTMSSKPMGEKTLHMWRLLSFEKEDIFQRIWIWIW